MNAIKLAAIAATLCCLLLVMNEGMHNDAKPQAAPAPAPQPVAKAQMAAAPALARTANPPAQRCETHTVSGSHTARAEWEARQGALEDAADVCPAGKAHPLQVNCAPVAAAQGILGEAAMRCVQLAACTLCGEDLARQREVDRFPS